MIKSTFGTFAIKSKKDDDGINYELFYFIDLTDEEKNKLKSFRENFAKTSSIHFHFEEQKFCFSQKKYFKKKQFVKSPPKTNSLKTDFISDVKSILIKFNNFEQFDLIRDLDESEELSLNEILGNS